MALLSCQATLLSSIDTRSRGHYNYGILLNVRSSYAGKLRLACVILMQFMSYSLYVELSFSGWAFSFCRLCSCTCDVFCHVNIRHKASETLRMFSTEPDASSHTHRCTTGLRSGCFLPPWTPSLAMDVEYTLLIGVLVCQQTTRNDTSAGASHQQRTAIA